MIKEFFLRTLDTARIMRAWEKLADGYHFFEPPSCPSADNLEHYGQRIQSLPRGSRVLILGVTPQLRNLLKDFDGEIFVADFSRKMRQSTLLRIPKQILKKEIFLWINWLNLGSAVEPHSLDLVMGDLVFANIRPQDRAPFLDVIYNLLKPGGYFVTRMKLHSPYWSSVDSLSIIKRDLESEAFKRYNRDQFLLYRFGDKIINPENFSFRTHDFDPLFKEALRQASPEQIHYIRRRRIYYNNIDMVRSYFPKEAFNAFVSSKFDITDILIAGDFEESEFFPVYILKKR